MMLRCTKSKLRGGGHAMTIAKVRSVRRDFDRLFREGNLSGTRMRGCSNLFVSERDEAAFEALAARDVGVWSSALAATSWATRPTPRYALQATFLVLFRRAATIRRRESLAGWLHRVACRVARQALAEAGSRRESEKRAIPPAGRTSDVHDPIARDELGRLLHAEIERLPERYRWPGR